ncbi:MAG: hypothetical protein FWB98_08165, partial [Defluviitaleaceae bacterium]|nr:hypothetical protein [Defluviitaleaceae bacterium]
MTKKGLPLRLLVPGVILLVIILCSLFMTIYSYFAHHNATVESYGTQAMRMAQTLASVIEPEGFARIVETRVQDDYWHQVQDALDRIINETGVQFVYALFPTYDGGYVTYFGAGLAAHHEWGVYFGMQDPVEYFSDEMFQALRDGVATKSGIYDGGDAIGLLIGGFAPIIDSA